MRFRDIFLPAVGFVLLWNSGFIGAEYGLPYAGPFSLLFWRYAALTGILFVSLLVRGRLRWVGWRSAGVNMTVGFLAHGVWLGCVLLALDRGVPAGIVALVVALQPLATGAFSGVTAGEPTGLKRWIGLFIGFAGVAVTVGFRIDLGDAGSVFGYLVPLGSVAAITAASLIQRRLDVRHDAKVLPVDLALFYQCAATAVVMAIPAIFAERLVTEWAVPFVLTMLWLVVGVSLGAYGLMWVLIDRLDATRVASLFYLGPPVTMLMAWGAFGDVPRGMDLVGMVIVFAGVGLSCARGPAVRG
ncbi:putative DMT superfamily transporter inner membrane protein [Anaerohalosphaera lusitana]|uniref:Putative DMT superfamily transporter inner membrane protein n=1 Tax=Anaerohalosphaera lusitana TaxID=1936003 RepID=A0A1U9NIB4_9BACT|nr:DMT family transporter [Anaerohalosphaera lusitana]AQT67488.1 putative DMT superfamily transporter inner membrane protein [Anaerohalosphaera lusitana]